MATVSFNRDLEADDQLFAGKPLLYYEGKQSWDSGVRTRKSPCEEASETWSYNVIDKRLQYAYVLDGYRREPTLFSSILSLFTLHNETVNVWSHLGGFLVTAYLLLCLCFGATYASLTDNGMTEGEWAILCFYDCCMMVMFGCSACYHLFRDQSARADKLLLRFDHMGIIFQILGSFVSTLYFLFATDSAYNTSSSTSSPDDHIIHLNRTIASLASSVSIPISDHLHTLSAAGGGMHWFQFYAGCITFLCLAAGLVLSLPHCSRRFKFLQSSCAYAVTFGSIITFCVIPFTHAAIVKGISSQEFRMCGGYFLMLMLYATGCVFYLLKMPECFFPGKFDYFGGSHNLFHIFIVMAAFAHYATNFRFLELRCQQRMAGLHA